MDENSSIKTNNQIINENKLKIFEKSFDRLVNLQALLKKESSLKEICKTLIIILYFFIFIVIKTREDTSKILQEICHEIYTQKLEFNNIIAEKVENDNRKFELPYLLMSFLFLLIHRFQDIQNFKFILFIFPAQKFFSF